MAMLFSSSNSQRRNGNAARGSGSSSDARQEAKIGRGDEAGGVPVAKSSSLGQPGESVSGSTRWTDSAVIEWDLTMSSSPTEAGIQRTLSSPMPERFSGLVSPGTASPRQQRAFIGSASPSPSDFAEVEANLQRLLEEGEWRSLDSEIGSMLQSPGSQSPAYPLGASPSASYVELDNGSPPVVKNLDTGEIRNLLHEKAGSQFYGTWASPPKVRRGRSTPSAWDSWWQEQRHCSTELWKAAETGDVDRLREMVGSVSSLPASASPSELGLLEGSGVDSAIVGSARLNGASGIYGTVDSSYGSAFASQGPSRSELHLDVRAIHGRTALHMAASGGHMSCVEALLSGGTDREARTDDGFTPIHLAAQRGHLEVVSALHSAGCSLWAQTNEGETPLHLASTKGHAAVVTFVLENATEESLTTKNSQGQRPFDTCLDLPTYEIFQTSSVSQSICSSVCSENEDQYAGRTPYVQGSVLLRNSRADMVKKLLNRTGGDAAKSQVEVEPADIAGGRPAEKSDGGEVVPSQSSGRGSYGNRVRNEIARSGTRRQSFSKLSSQENTEGVGPTSFQLKSVLGKGSFGEVYQVVHKKTGEIYAMKVLKKSKIISRNLVRYAMTERNLLSYIRHPFIVRLHYAFQTPSCLVLVLEYCSGGSLSALIAREGCLPEALARLYLAEIFLAIEHLHERQVVYRDLKPENVVLDDNSHAMLTDFGLSKEGVFGLRGTKSFCGSVAYLAPEILARAGHGPPVDMYGLGVLLYEVLAGHPPFYSRDRDTLFRNITTATLHAPARAGPKAAKIIHDLMQRDPAHRLGARRTSDVRAHTFFADLDWDKVLARQVPVPPLRRLVKSTAGSSSRASSPTAGAKVPSPFEGRLEAQVRKSWNSTSEVSGWDFASPTPSPGSVPPEGSPRMVVHATSSAGAPGSDAPASDTLSASDPDRSAVAKSLSASSSLRRGVSGSADGGATTASASGPASESSPEAPSHKHSTGRRSSGRRSAGDGHLAGVVPISDVLLCTEPGRTPTAMSVEDSDVGAHEPFLLS